MLRDRVALTAILSIATVVMALYIAFRGCGS
ncbi:hypothetical protein LCGC14_1775270 [marine sediment metagenome]|uniref:Uncharacterized protein n=1 Tax=marine sediment metagenome TaxID=412755 RepID=A0A0F9HJK2_9ZZZZ